MSIIDNVIDRAIRPAPDPKMQVCFNCQHAQHPPDKTFLVCRRFPPALHGGYWMQPLVQGDGQCGEFKRTAAFPWPPVRKP
jgi:hypothetical protein